MKEVVFFLVIVNILMMAYFGVRDIKEFYRKRDKRKRAEERQKMYYKDLIKRPWALDNNNKVCDCTKSIEKASLELGKLNKHINDAKIFPERDTFDVNQFRS